MSIETENKVVGHVTVNDNLDTLIERALKRSGMGYRSFVRSITQNAFRSLTVWEESDLERFLLTCEQLGLSPVGNAIYAVQSESSGSQVLLCVGLDGWVQILNQHPAFDGMQFKESKELVGGVPQWIECTIYRSDRRVPLSVKEYFTEVRRDSTAWSSHPRRMLRHKAMVQCARLSFNLSMQQNIFDPEELSATVNSSQTSTVGKTGQGTSIEPPMQPCSADYINELNPSDFNTSTEGGNNSEMENRQASWLQSKGKAAPSGPSSTQDLIRRLEVLEVDPHKAIHGIHQC